MSSVKSPGGRPPLVHDGSRFGDALARSWISVALIPAFLLGSVIVTLFLYELLGYKPENADAPLWVDAVIGIVAMVVFLVPCVAAVIYGRRANLGGDRRGLVPVVLGVLAGVSLSVLTIVSTLGPF